MHTYFKVENEGHPDYGKFCVCFFPKDVSDIDDAIEVTFLVSEVEAQNLVQKLNGGITILD